MYPFIDLFGRQIPTYGLSILIAIFLVGWLACRYARKVALPWEDVLIVGACALLSGFLCGFLLYLLVTYSPLRIWEMVKDGDYRFLNGGLVFYGALIGGLAGGLIGVKLSKAPLSAVEKSVIPYIPIGHAIGRIGCVLAGCCYGAPYDGICALYYKNSLFGLAPNQGYFPVQPLEAILNLAIALCLMIIRKKKSPKLSLLISYLGMYSIVRFFLEFFRGDAIRGIVGGLSTSQWISLAILTGCVIYFVLIKSKRNIEKTSQSH